MAANGLYYPCDEVDARLLTALRDAAADLYAALGAGDPSTLRGILADTDEGALRTPLAAVEVAGRRTWLHPDESVPAAADRLGTAAHGWEIVDVVDNAGAPGRSEPHTVTFVVRALE